MLISILPILAKLLERFVHSSFTEYLEKHKLLTNAQSAFKILHYIVTSLFNVTNRQLKHYNGSSDHLSLNVLGLTA